MGIIKRYAGMLLRWYTGFIDMIISWSERHTQRDFRYDPFSAVKDAFWTIPVLIHRIIIKTKNKYFHNG